VRARPCGDRSPQLLVREILSDCNFEVFSGLLMRVFPPCLHCVVGVVVEDLRELGV
jgi:hypothetical protein